MLFNSASESSASLQIKKKNQYMNIYGFSVAESFAPPTKKNNNKANRPAVISAAAKQLQSIGSTI